MPRFLSRLAVAGTALALAAGPTTPTASLAAASQAVGGPASRSGTLTWAALGDSYTAGVIEATGELTAPADGCGRTTGSYPEVLRRDLGSRVSLRNVSCSGATVLDVSANKQSPSGRPLPPLGTDPDAPYPAVPPQADAVGPDTDVITVGVGGNDLGFAGILKDCIMLGATSLNRGTPCKDEYDPRLPGLLAELRTHYSAMLGTLRTKAPAARIVSVGYPHLVPENAALCTYGDLLQFSTVTTGDLAWARAAVLEPLNALIAQETTARGGTFVDLYADSAGHSVCDADHWLDGVLTSIIPLRYALVHPNARGQAFAAARVRTAVLGG
ncbi:SGNH/GDSL hydrolase family protein [Kitasatospora sp. NPDC001539]|uniref:SGNH/GDSL hydrolase family protein n=1 Tax=Kitasatospora sp. NPDC001539 TaxID=3154384 RepID=UPI0033274652